VPDAAERTGGFEGSGNAAKDEDSSQVIISDRHISVPAIFQVGIHTGKEDIPLLPAISYNKVRSVVISEKSRMPLFRFAIFLFPWIGVKRPLC
jgi:hypothetical protein